MTRYALLAVVDGQEKRYGIADDAQAAEDFRPALEAGLGVPVRVDGIPPAHPAECLTCCRSSAREGSGQ
ncbi:hypothetical protein ACIBTV_26635 [Micromonospora sp. NPDC049366]|uniref:hypothetical protein n=1 Tax=Micromonospora sp. NPDC049366 TaxID=3364271 RepID=UPI003787FF46